MKLNESFEYLQMKVNAATGRYYRQRWRFVNVGDWNSMLSTFFDCRYSKLILKGSGCLWPKLSKPSPTPRLQHRFNRPYFVSLTVNLFTIILKMLNYVNCPIVNGKVSYLWYNNESDFLCSIISFHWSHAPTELIPQTR